MVPLAAGALFIAAGALKLSGATGGGGEAWTDSPALGVAEMAFGGWLLSGVGRRLAVPACATVLGAFAAFHLWQIARGNAAPCGCLGPVDLPHGLLAALCLSGSAACLLARPGPLRSDLATVTLVAATPASPPPETPQEATQASHLQVLARRLRGPSVLAPVCFLALTGWTLVTAAVQAATPAPAPPRTWAQDVLDRLPKAHRAALAQGAWRVLVIDPKCDSCQRVLAETEGAYLSGLANERLLVVMTGAGDADAGRLFGALDAQVVTLSGYAPPCLPAVLVLGNGQFQHTSCGGSAGLPPASGILVATQ